MPQLETLQEMPSSIVGYDIQQGLLLLLGLFIGQQVLKSTTDWTVKQGLGWAGSFLVSETTGRDEKSGNEEAVRIDEYLERKLEKQEQEIEEREREVSNYERMIRSLRRNNISKKQIIQQYWRPLPAIIITFFNDYTYSDQDEKFVKKHIMEHNQAESLTALTYAIPPKGFPSRFDDSSKVGRGDIEEWIQEDILGEYPTGRVAICQASTVDLRRVYSYTDYEKHEFNRRTIDEALDIESILDRHDVHRILAKDNVNLSRAIENGDIAFSLSRYISQEELALIHEHQEEIQSHLGNPTLRRAAQDDFVKELSEAISEFVEEPEEPAKKAVEEAKLWYDELQS